jgi:hypothetical protein
VATKHLTGSHDSAFVADPELLLQLDSFLAEINSPRKYTLACKGGETLYYDDIRAVLDFPNYGHRSVVNLTAQVATPTFDATISIENHTVPNALFPIPSGTVKYDLRGEDRIVDRLAQQLTDWRAELTP